VLYSATMSLDGFIAGLVDDMSWLTGTSAPYVNVIGARRGPDAWAAPTRRRRRTSGRVS
jgi:hypothetical protein